MGGARLLLPCGGIPAQPWPSMDPSLELFRARHAVFVRKAREAAHQALLFLGVLEKTDSPRTNRALEEHATFSLWQVDALLEGVYLPADHHAVPPGAAADALPLAEHWREIRAGIDGRRSLMLDEVRGVEERLHAFLLATRPAGRLNRLFACWLPNALGYLHKNLALILAALFAVGGALGFEMFRSLFLNEGRLLLLPLAFLALPHLASRVLIARARRRDLTPFWDVAGDAFRSFRFQAREPERDVVRWPAGSRAPLEIIRGQAVRLLAYLAWFAVVCVAYRGLLVGWVGSTSLTVFVILALFYLVLLAGRMLDYWDFLDPRPVRMLVLYLVVGFLVADLAFTAGSAYLVAVSILLAGLPVVRFLRRRGPPVRVGYAAPFLLVGGLAWWERAAGARTVWADPPADAAAPARLAPAEWPYPAGRQDDPVVVLAASSGGSRAALYTALTLQRLAREFPEVARRLQAVSGVSGGSLASAAYVARMLDAGGHPAAAAAVDGLPEDLTANFALPTFLAGLTPGVTRGEGIEAVWREEVGLGERRLGDLARAWRGAAARGDSLAPFPVPLFNATTVNGHDLVMSPLSRALYVPDDGLSAAEHERLVRAGADDLTWVYDRDGIYALEDLLDRYDPPVARAVLASASAPFPYFGFPFVEIRTRKPLRYSPARSDRDTTAKLVQLTDGALLSSSGLWPLYHLLMRKAPELRERGVLLIVVDAASMPPSVPNGRRAMVSLTGTVEGYVPKSQLVNRQMYALLQKEFGHRLAIVQLDMVPRDRYNVPTAWALTARAQQIVRESFERRWAEERSLLPAKWRAIQARNAASARVFPAPLRPPVD